MEYGYGHMVINTKDNGLITRYMVKGNSTGKMVRFIMDSSQKVRDMVLDV